MSCCASWAIMLPSIWVSWAALRATAAMTSPSWCVWQTQDRSPGWRRGLPQLLRVPPPPHLLVLPHRLPPSGRRSGACAGQNSYASLSLAHRCVRVCSHSNHTTYSQPARLGVRRGQPLPGSNSNSGARGGRRTRTTPPQQSC
jgi:hypothetical protein